MSAPAVTSRGEDYSYDRIKSIVTATRLVPWNHPDLDDIVQEVAIALWRKQHMNASVVARSAIVDYLRSHGTITRGGNPRVARDTLSLDGPAKHSDNLTIADTIASDDPLIEDMDFESDGGQELLKRLTAAERRMVLAVANGVQLKVIGREHGISESRVSQIVDRAKRRLTGEIPPAARSPLRARPILPNNGYPWDTPYRRKTELLMLQYLSDGLTQRQIAEKTRYSYRTIGSYVQNATKRMGANTAEQAVAEAIRRGLID